MLIKHYMTIDLWLSLVFICMLGALSPGPSLALVIRNTIQGDKNTGLATALSHGFGVALYALFAVTGIGLIIVKSPIAFDVVRYLGALFLVYLAFNALKSKGSTIDLKFNQKTSVQENQVNINGWRDGFLIAFLNPKLAMFFIALFSQFVDVNATLLQNIIMVLTVGVIDTVWYLLVVLGISRESILLTLKRNSAKIDKLTGVILLILAARVILT